MKKFNYIIAVLVLIMASCSDDDAKGSVTVLADGEPINSLELISNQKVELTAILKCSQGNIVEDFTTAWTVSGSVGTFSNPTSSVTDFTALNGSATGHSITVDCDGIKKRIPLTISLFEISISFSGSNSIKMGETKEFTATAKLNGQDYSGTVEWGVAAGSISSLDEASFFPSTTQTGEPVTFTAPMDTR